LGIETLLLFVSKRIYALLEGRKMRMEKEMGYTFLPVMGMDTLL